ncbi:NYN domain-containing protein [Chitinivorax sp. B]|uniref:LabA-like NYN domain-containing protein n=1 Tax=Chitinivorax sp. B TaxID=2502235 RepID=UPI0010F4D135|nr:NYN domain-containing protein [Chitinivorax sp. B]
MRRVGVYVDASNIGMNGGHGMRYEVLRTLACRGGGEPQRLNVYLAFDAQRADREPEYLQKASNYQAALRDQGFRVTVKQVRRFYDDEGMETKKANADLDMAVDVLTESERLDTVVLVTGDGDFVQVARALQSKGCRVEVVAFDNVSRELRDTADQFINGLLVPNLVPVRNAGPASPRWGEIGSRVRGVCQTYQAEQRYGFIRYLSGVPNSIVLAGQEETRSAFFRGGDLPNGLSETQLPSRDIILEFELSEPAKIDGLPVARRIDVIASI